MNPPNTPLNHIKDWTKLAEEVNWSAAVLARRCGVSVRTLERYFLKSLNRTPKAWLVEHRQDKAMKLLSNGLRIKETAERLGYKYATHFSREFKKQSGRSPSTQLNFKKEKKY